jgi:hydroxylamine reductase
MDPAPFLRKEPLRTEVGIRLGPTLPAFLSDNVVKVLVENFDIKPIGEVKADVEAMMAGA